MTDINFPHSTYTSNQTQSTTGYGSAPVQLSNDSQPSPSGMVAAVVIAISAVVCPLLLLCILWAFIRKQRQGTKVSVHPYDVNQTVDAYVPADVFDSSDESDHDLEQQRPKPEKGVSEDT